MKDPVIGRVPFTDVIEHAVYKTGNAWQYVIDGAGLPVFGVWILARDDEADAPVNAAAAGS